MKEYWVYALKSQKCQRIYVGISSDIEKRLRMHNNRNVFSTKGYTPWKIIYTKKIGNRSDARIEEKKLKSGFGKEFLKGLL